MNMNANDLSSEVDSILDKQRRYLWPSHLNYYHKPLPLDHGEGSYVWGVDGQKYLDFFGGILTTSIGHNHPDLVEQTSRQIAKLIHSSTLYPHRNHVMLAEKIAELAPGDLSMSYFTNSGTEANELALMAARAYTGNYEILAFRHGYSGNSATGKALTGQSAWRQESSIVPGIKHAINPYCYRCPFKMRYPSCDVACAQDVEDVIRTTTSGRVAALLAEPIQGVGGFITPPKEYFGIVAEIVRNHGGVFIADEVQTGFGRTGGTWFGIEQWGVEPEIMTMAKGIANGFPMGNTITTPAVAESIATKGHLICTFGGNPVSTIASLTTISVMEREAGPAETEVKGRQLRTGLEEIASLSPCIGEVRGMGLMIGLEIVSDRETKEPAPEIVAEIFELTKNKGLLIGKGGMFNNVLRITPPLTASAQEIGDALQILKDTFNEIEA